MGHDGTVASGNVTTRGNHFLLRSSQDTVLAPLMAATSSPPRFPSHQLTNPRREKAPRQKVESQGADRSQQGEIVFSIKTIGASRHKTDGNLAAARLQRSESRGVSLPEAEIMTLWASFSLLEERENQLIGLNRGESSHSMGRFSRAQWIAAGKLHYAMEELVNEGCRTNVLMR